MSTSAAARTAAGDVAARSRRNLQAAVRWGLMHGLPRAALGVAASRGDVQARLFLDADDVDQRLPLAQYDEVRRAGAFQHSTFGHATARQPVVKECLSSPDVHAGIELSPQASVLSRAGRWAAESEPLGPLTPPSLLATEPPDHTRMRRLVTRVFSVKAVQDLQTRATQVADELLDGLADDAATHGAVDVVDRYAAVLPVRMICEILGVPDDEHDRVRDFGMRVAPSLDIGMPWSRFRAVDTALHEFHDWIAAHVERVRAHPGDNLLSQLVRARDEDGQPLTSQELNSTAGLVLAAGFETTVNLIGNGIALLDAHRAQRRALLAGDADWATAVEEVLRFDPPVLLTGRTVVRDTVIAGSRLEAGSVVTTLLAAANRDPEVFDAPNVFDVTRDNADDHVAFSWGRHYCLGAALARMEGVVALQRLHERFPDLEVLPGGRRRDTRILRGWARLPVALG